MEAFIKEAASVRPSRNQLAWFDTEFYGFVHFSPNTYTGLEWGDGTEDPAIFNPTGLDCDQWVTAFKSAGIKGMVLTAKHHDGFCLWQTQYTEHSIKNSPFQNGKGDIVREAAEACRRGGIQFGIYLSPWDRNSPYYGSDAYNDYYKAQLTELLTNYGDIFMVWFDGACGEGPNGKRQIYDFPGYIELVHKYQPKAVIFSDDIRWVGNEAGKTRYAEWAVVPVEYGRSFETAQTGPSPLAYPVQDRSPTDPDIGSLGNILSSKGLIFKPAEVDMSIRPGWFYHPYEKPHCLERLFDTYIRTVGGNTCFHLNVPPTPAGVFDEQDVARLAELGTAIQEAFSKPLDACIHPLLTECHTARYEITLSSLQSISYIVLEEDIARGQRIESFVVRRASDGIALFHGTTIGHKRICPVALKEERLILDITFARDTPCIKKIRIYGQ